MGPIKRSGRSEAAAVAGWQKKKISLIFLAGQWYSLFIFSIKSRIFFMWLGDCGWMTVAGWLWLDGCGWAAVAGWLWLVGWVASRSVGSVAGWLGVRVAR